MKPEIFFFFGIGKQGSPKLMAGAADTGYIISGCLRIVEVTDLVSLCLHSAVALECRTYGPVTGLAHSSVRNY